MGNYYQDCEDICNDLFVKWAEQTKIFKDMVRQPLLSRIDWKCVTIKDNKVNCELKYRSSLAYDTIFIEPGKYEILMKQWQEEKVIPWFINLCGDEVLLFDLRIVKPIGVKEVYILDKAHMNHKWVQRYELPTNKALRFINGIKK